VVAQERKKGRLEGSMEGATARGYSVRPPRAIGVGRALGSEGASGPSYRAPQDYDQTRGILDFVYCFRVALPQLDQNALRRSDVVVAI